MSGQERPRARGRARAVDPNAGRGQQPQGPWPPRQGGAVPRGGPRPGGQAPSQGAGRPRPTGPPLASQAQAYQQRAPVPMTGPGQVSILVFNVS